ncbi:MAG: HAMP domain-containing sensor histidine kinase, partial [Pseudomonadales bacterium]|nr:HAMP domain-containing sensor histidine kinase [Pseudomonadales bacterium]
MFGNATPDAAVAASLLVALVCLGAALAMLRGHGHGRRRRIAAPTARPAPPPRYVTQRDELLATLGHELRSPLRALLALLDLDADEVASTARRGELRSLAAHALRVAEDSLDFALLEQGAVRLKPARIDLEHELAALLAVVRPLRTRGVSLELDLAPGLAVVREGDGARLRQILVNLVANALAHTEHGSVRVSVDVAEADPTVVRFVVRDSGTGMTPTERQRAFRPFAQGDAPRGRAGIGLAVVARIVEAMSGDVFLESEPGLGSRFVVDLPLPALEPPADGAVELAGRLVGVCCATPSELRSVAAHLQHWEAEVLRFPDAASLAAHLEAERPLDALVLGLDDVPT